MKIYTLTLLALLFLTFNAKGEFAKRMKNNKINLCIPKPSDGEGLNSGQIIDALQSPEVVKAVTEHLSSEGGGSFLIMSNEDQQAALNHVKAPSNSEFKPNGFISTFREAVSEFDIKPAVREIHDMYDKDLASFGVKKEPGVRTYEAYKNHVKGLNAQVEELNKAIKEGVSDEKLNQLNQELQGKIDGFENDASEKIKVWEEKYNNLNKEYSTFKSGSVVDNEYLTLSGTFKPKEELGSFFDAHKKDVLAYAKSNHKQEEDGTTFITNPDGTIKKDSQFNRITVKQYLESEFKDAIKTQRVISGAGSGNPDNTGLNIDPSTITADNFDIGDANTQAELIQRMTGLGLKRGSKEFTEIYAKFHKGLKPS